MNRLITRLCSTFTEVKKIQINQSDLVYKYVRGSGPGGQAMQKTSNAVQLTHLPTGFIVQANESRNCETNKQYAYKKMKQKLDDHYNGENSKRNQKIQKMAKNKKRKQAKSRKKHGVDNKDDNKDDQQE